jgi:hypothetical protein
MISARRAVLMAARRASANSQRNAAKEEVMSATPAATLDVRLVGYLVRQSDGTAVGEVEGVRTAGLRVHKIPGHPHHAGYVPAAAFAGVDHPTNTVILIPDITIRRIVDAPPPPDQAADAWHKSADWWADLLGHYGLFESEGRKSEPFLHPDQR